MNAGIHEAPRVAEPPPEPYEITVGAALCQERFVKTRRPMFDNARLSGALPLSACRAAGRKRRAQLPLISLQESRSMSRRLISRYPRLTFSFGTQVLRLARGHRRCRSTAVGQKRHLRQRKCRMRSHRLLELRSAGSSVVATGSSTPLDETASCGGGGKHRDGL